MLVTIQAAAQLSSADPPCTSEDTEAQFWQDILQPPGKGIAFARTPVRDEAAPTPIIPPHHGRLQASFYVQTCKSACYP